MATGFNFQIRMKVADRKLKTPICPAGNFELVLK
jgi:hypothetical protein